MIQNILNLIGENFLGLLVLVLALWYGIKYAEKKRKKMETEEKAQDLLDNLNKQEVQKHDRY